MKNTTLLVIMFILFSIGILGLYRNFKTTPLPVDNENNKPETQEPIVTNSETPQDFIQSSNDSETSVLVNNKYNFELSFPKIFNGNSIEVEGFDVANENDFISKQSVLNISNDASYAIGSFFSTSHIIDFGIINSNDDSRKASFLEIATHPNKSNLSFEDFISKEISNIPEGIKDKKSFSFDNISGYAITLPSAYYSNPESLIYYFPVPDNKTILSFGINIYRFKNGPPPGEPPFEITNGFIKTYPEYQNNINEIENLYMNDDKQNLYAKYPEFKLYENSISAESVKAINAKILAFEQILKSVKFNNP